MTERLLADAPDAARGYVLLDVFALTPLSGNPLAVFTDGAGLSAPQMQRAARELNLSESVFLELEGDRARARIFTPSAELPFAGHPVLGAGFVAARLAGEGEVEVLTARGAVRVSVNAAGRAAMVQPLPTEIDSAAARALLEALGIDTTPLIGPAAFENGPRHVFVVLDDPGTLAALAPDMNALARCGEWLVSCAAIAGEEVRMRTFLPALGVNEDPATGAAAGPLAVHLCRIGLAPWNAWLTIRQGEALGRPSLLEALARGDGQRLAEVRVRGQVAVVGEGRLLVGAAAP